MAEQSDANNPPPKPKPFTDAEKSDMVDAGGLSASESLMYRLTRILPDRADSIMESRLRSQYRGMPRVKPPVNPNREIGSTRVPIAPEMAIKADEYLEAADLPGISGLFETDTSDGVNLLTYLSKKRGTRFKEIWGDAGPVDTAGLMVGLGKFTETKVKEIKGLSAATDVFSFISKVMDNYRDRGLDFDDPGVRELFQKAADSIAAAVIGKTNSIRSWSPTHLESTIMVEALASIYRPIKYEKLKPVGDMEGFLRALYSNKVERFSQGNFINAFSKPILGLAEELEINPDSIKRRS